MKKKHVIVTIYKIRFVARVAVSKKARASAVKSLGGIGLPAPGCARPQGSMPCAGARGKSPCRSLVGYTV